MLLWVFERRLPRRHGCPLHRRRHELATAVESHVHEPRAFARQSHECVKRGPKRIGHGRHREATSKLNIFAQCTREPRVVGALALGAQFRNVQRRVGMRVHRGRLDGRFLGHAPLRRIRRSDEDVCRGAKIGRETRRVVVGSAEGHVHADAGGKCRGVQGPCWKCVAWVAALAKLWQSVLRAFVLKTCKRGGEQQAASIVGSTGAEIVGAVATCTAR
mmetsp:Transcript_14160/g.36693  ORF Transcript_14160/g.36693 Transcript_14160/m.36693 type:complete len:217 (+) Transcript_14160:475-1125(+)